MKNAIFCIAVVIAVMVIAIHAKYLPMIIRGTPILLYAVFYIAGACLSFGRVRVVERHTMSAIMLDGFRLAAGIAMIILVLALQREKENLYFCHYWHMIGYACMLGIVTDIIRFIIAPLTLDADALVGVGLYELIIYMLGEFWFTTAAIIATRPQHVRAGAVSVLLVAPTLGLGKMTVFSVFWASATTAAVRLTSASVLLPTLSVSVVVTVPPFLATTLVWEPSTFLVVSVTVPVILFSDWNYFQSGKVTYLTRTDWAGTFLKTYDNMAQTNRELIDYLNGKINKLHTGDDTSDIKWGVDSGLKLCDMYGVPYDDPKWDQLLDQFTLEEAMYIFSFGGPSIPGADSVGAIETYMTANAGNGIAVSLNASKDPDASWAISRDDPDGTWHPEVFANAPMGASTFNPKLMRELGEFEGIESLFTGINILWGPGLNTHRHTYNGRNGECYSEDPVLSGVAAMEFAIGTLDYGLVAAPKHFAFNDQETESGGVSPYMTEQRAREVELRAYQIAFEATKYDTADFDAGMRGLMTSFSKIGAIECTSSYGLMTEILANEWGFIGYAVTDIYDDVNLWTAVPNSGTTCFDTRSESGFYDTTTLNSCYLFTTQMNSAPLNVHLIDGDTNLQLKLKDAVHKNIFAWSESHLMNRYNATTHFGSRMTWWRATYLAWKSAPACWPRPAPSCMCCPLRKKEEKKV